jgi:hypothetical protein
MAPVKIRRSLAGRNRQQVVARLVVPAHIARLIPEEQQFEVELTEDGLLYRPVGGEEQQPVELPTWLQK